MCLLDNFTINRLKFDVHVLKMYTILYTTDKEKSDEDIHLLRVELWGWVMYSFSPPCCQPGQQTFKP